MSHRKVEPVFPWIHSCYRRPNFQPVKIRAKQESRMRPTHFSDSRGFRWRRGPLKVDPWRQNPPGGRLPCRQTPLEVDPQEGTWDWAARQEVTSYRDSPHGQTNTCENFTLPQTSFAGGNKKCCHSFGHKWYQTCKLWSNGIVCRHSSQLISLLLYYIEKGLAQLLGFF